MKLGDKSLSEMTQEECLEAISILRAEREELRKEAIRRKQEPIGIMISKKKKVVKQKESTNAGMLAFLKGETNEIK